MGRTSILVILIFICFISCKNYYINEKGGYRPKKANFEFAKTPYILKKEDMIDTASVYVSEGTVLYGEELRKRTSYIIFLSNGRCYLGRNDRGKSELSLEVLNNFNGYGSIGYYRINNDKIKIESYEVTLGGARGNTGYFVKNSGYIKNDVIYLFIDPNVDVENLPISNNQNSAIYIRRKVEGLTGTPDW